MEPTRGFLRGRALAWVLCAVGLGLGLSAAGGCQPMTPLPFDDGGVDGGEHAGVDGGVDAGPVCGDAPVASCAPCADGTICDDGTATCAGGQCLCSAGACARGCLIAGVFHADGDPDPDDACAQCDAGASTSTWTPVADGTPCADDGNACTRDACAAGTCTHTRVAPGRPCGASGQCDASGTCSAYCDIWGLVVPDGTVNPANPCQICDTRRITGAWSPGPDGAACADDGLACTRDVCTAGRCAHPPVTAGTVCGSGLICDATGACVTECLILGTFYADGSPNPADPCQLCRPALSTSTWSSVANGTPCPAAPCGSWGPCTFAGPCDTTGARTRNCAPYYCASGYCVAGVFAQESRSCTRPSQDGAACDDGQACTQGDVCTGGVCAGQAYSCTAGSACTTSACDGVGGCVVTDAPDGTPCTAATCGYAGCDHGVCQACANAGAKHGYCCASQDTCAASHKACP